MKQKKIPLRQCVGCKEHRPKRELIRVVRSPDGVVALDFRGKNPGRGAYICPNEACFARARKSRALERALGCAMPDEVFGELERQLKEAGGSEADGDG